jgi:uncharacterized protein YnzC (UPF0291/DUF896 family)
MARIRTYDSQVQSNGLSGGAQATDIRALTDDGKQALYGAAADLGNFGMQLGLKEMAFNDSMLNAKSAQIMRNAELDYQTKIEKDPDTNNWGKYQKEVILNAQSEIKKLKFGTNKGQKINDVESKTWAGLFSKSAQVEMIKQKSRNTLATTEAIFENEMMFDDGSKESALKLNLAMESYKKALDTSLPPELAAATFNAKVQALQTKRAKDRALQIAVSFRDETGMIDLNKAQTFLNAHEGLNAENKLEVIKKVNDWDSQEKINLKNSWETAKGQFEADAQKMLNGGQYVELIEKAETFDAKTKGEFLSEQAKLKTEYIKLARGALAGKENIDNQIVIDRLNSSAFSVYSGEKTREDFTKEINEEFYLRHNLTPETRKDLLAKMDNPLTPEQSKIVEDYVKDTRQQILAQSSGGLTMDLGAGTSYVIKNANQSDIELANRLKLVNLYEKALTTYVVKNGGDVGGKFRDYADDLRIQYTNMAYKDIQTKIAASESKTPIPANTVKIKMPDGKIWNLPSDKAQAAIERGGIKL